MQINIPTASPVHLAQTGNCFPFQKKDLSGLQWHPNTIGIHLFIKPKNLSSKESNSNSNAAYKYPIQDRASNRDKCSDSGCFCIFWLIISPYQEKNLSSRFALAAKFELLFCSTFNMLNILKKKNFFCFYFFASSAGVSFSTPSAISCICFSISLSSATPSTAFCI